MIDNLADASLQGAVAFVIVWAVLKALPRLPAVWRVWLWRLVLLKFALAPLVGFPILLPSSPAPSIPEVASSPPVSQSSTLDVAGAPDVSAPTFKPLSTAPEPTAAPRLSPIPGLMSVWLAGVAAMAARTVLGFGRARQLAKSGTPIDDELLPKLIAQVRIRAQYPSRIALRATPKLLSPAVMGIGRRTVLVPDGFQFRPSEAVQAALAHEVAHLVRRDCEWSLLGELVRAVFWFHPLVWLALREGRAEAEIAADRLAREWTDASPREYASSLLTFVGPAGVGIRPPRVEAGLLHATHELTRRFEAMSLNRYSRRTLVRLTAFGLVPMALIFVPLRVSSAPPRVDEPSRNFTVPQNEKPQVLLIPVKRSREEMIQMAADEGLNVGGNMGPFASVEAVKKLQRGVGKGSYTFVVKDKDWRIELLGLSHIEPGRSKSWSIDGKPLPYQLPFGPSSGIPIAGDFERQIVIRYTDKTVRGVHGFFRVRSQGDTPGPMENNNTIPIPMRLNGDRVIAIQQGFPESARYADFILKYYLVPEPYRNLAFRKGQVVSDPAGWNTALNPADTFASGKKKLVFDLKASNSILTFRKPAGLQGTLRVETRLRNGRVATAQSISAGFPEFTFARHPELGDGKELSTWLIQARKEDIAEVSLKVAKQGMVGFRDIPLHPQP